MRRFHHIAVEIVICVNRASHRGNANGLRLHPQFLDTFRHQPVHNAVRAARAVVQRGVRQHFRLFKYRRHYLLASLTFKSSSSISAGVGTKPPSVPWK